MNRKKLIALSVVVILLITAVITFSYAFWGMTNEQTTMNKLTSGCLSIELVGEDAISLNNAYPITDEEGMVLKPYSFTITNTCDLFVSYNVSLEILNGSTLPIKYVRSMINKEAVVNLNSLESTTTSISDSLDSKILTSGSLGSGDSADYTLRIWMDENVTIENTDAMNKSLQSKVVVTAVPSSYSPVANGFTLLNEALLVNEYQTTNVDVAKNKIASKQEVDFTKTAPVIVWKEYHSNETLNKAFSKASPSTIGSYGITEAYTKILFGTSYTFDETTGYYKLMDKDNYNPEEVDFSEKNYYICSTSLVATTDNRVSHNNGSNCAKLLKIVSLTAVNDNTLTLSSGEVIPTIKYSFVVNQYGASELESDKSDKGLYKAEDDYGTSYYYRGNVSNNYVKYANFYWRVIRINGDGSIRLLYAGTDSNATGNDLGISLKKFNSIKNHPTYEGYMYSNILNASHIDAIRNDNDSTIKTVLDNWYKTNILDKGYNSYVADSGFCNDRTIAEDSPSDGNDISKNIYYSGRYRMFTINKPTYSCPNLSNDLFTLPGNNEGNNSLTYPIGLISGDEASFAGAVGGILNSMVYIISGESYYTMTPYAYAATVASTRQMTVSSAGNLYYSESTSNRSIRPVINLKSSTEISGGIGTKNDPFIVK